MKPKSEPDGSVATPLPPDLIEPDNKAIVTPKPPSAIEREEEEREKKIRKERGLV